MNIFDKIPTDLPIEIFESIQENESIKIERIISKGHSSPESGWHDQDKNEWVIVLKGAATILFENNISTKLLEGDYINIDAHKKHKVSWTSPKVETIWLVVHY